MQVFSERDRVCLNRDCTYTHLKGTKRYDTNEEHSTNFSTSRTRSRFDSYNRDEYKPHPGGRRRTYSNTSVASFNDNPGNRRRTYSNASASQEYRPRPPSAIQHQHALHKNPNESDFLEKRFRLMEEQLDEIKRLIRTPPQPLWSTNHMLADPSFLMQPQPPTLQPQSQSNISLSHPNLWNQPHLAQSNILSAY